MAGKEIVQTDNTLVNNKFIDALSKQIEEKRKYGMTFPKDYNPSTALTGAYLILKETCDRSGKSILDTCSQASIASALLQMVTLGLEAQSKQCYFIAYNGKCQLQKSYFGNVTIARRLGLRTINADVIYDGDVFEYSKKDAVTYIDKHIQKFENIDSGKVIGAYAVATLEDGRKITEIMTVKQIKLAWGQKPGGYKETAWDTHVKFFEEMSKKTVSNRLLKRIVNTFGNAYVNNTFDSVEEQENTDMIKAEAKEEIETNANSIEFEQAEKNEKVIEHVEMPVNIPNEDIPDVFKY